MAIALPTCPLPNIMQPFLRDFGGILSPFLGGPEQRINRIGTRLGCRYTMPEMDDADAQKFVSRLMRGKQDRVIMPWPITAFDPGTPPNPQINASSTGSALSVKGLGAGYTLVEGQPLSVVHGGRRYMHLSTGQVVANGSGIAAVGIFPPTRATYAVNDTVEIAMPMIEGYVSPGDEVNWTIALELDTAIAFSVVESA